MAHVHSVADQHRSRLIGAIALSIAILVLELIAAWRSGSLALLADAAHVFADVSGLALALGAIWLANRPTSTGRSFGLYRTEILAAALNAVLLLGVSAFVIIEGVGRVRDPQDIDEPIVVAVASIALVLNLASLALLRSGQRVSLTLRGAYLEVLGDSLGSLLVLVSALLIVATGFRQLDGLAAIAIGLLILPRTGRLLRDSVDVLLEATPRDVSLDEVRRHILETPDVQAVHDLHAWTITSGMHVVSAHIVVGPDANPGALLDHLGTCLAGDFDVDHSTFQLETPEHVLWEGRASQTQL